MLQLFPVPLWECLQQEWMAGSTGGWGDGLCQSGKRSRTLSHALSFTFPCLGTTCQVWFRFIPELAVCCCRNHIHTLPGHILLLVQMDKAAERDGAQPGVSVPPTAGLGSSTAHKPSVVLSTISQSKPNHETVLLLSDHVTSQKLCGGSAKSPVFSFAKLSQVIQSPERFFCQSEFAVIKLCSCEG